MKNIPFFYICIFITLFILNACKTNPTAGWFTSLDSDSDRFYIGKKYYLPNVKRFYGPPLVGYSDSITWEGVELGRRLFYDKHLSKSGTRSCASCHNYQYALSDSGNRFSLNEGGSTARNAPALQNLAWFRSFFWDGRASNLSIQQQDAFEHELSFKVKEAIPYLYTDTTDVALFKKAFGRPGTITEDKVYLAIEQFLLSAVTFNSKFDSVMRGEAVFNQSEQRGYYDVFLTSRGECNQCHKSPLSTTLLTDNKFHNNGLDFATSKNDFADAGQGKFTAKDSDYGTFKTPGLRNVALTAPYMHDGRFKTLRQVIDFYSDSLKRSFNLDAHLLPHIDTTADGKYKLTGGLHLTRREKEDLLNFLYTLTDTTFINSPALKNPFTSQ
jgi:cytochrome c peroxidase